MQVISVNVGNHCTRTENGVADAVNTSFFCWGQNAIRFTLSLVEAALKRPSLNSVSYCYGLAASAIVSEAGIVGYQLISGNRDGWPLLISSVWCGVAGGLSVIARYRARRSPSRDVDPS